MMDQLEIYSRELIILKLLWTVASIQTKSLMTYLGIHQKCYNFIITTIQLIIIF